MIWAEKIPQHYKRSETDCDTICPWCGKNVNWSLNRRLQWYRNGYAVFNHSCGGKVKWITEGVILGII